MLVKRSVNIKGHQTSYSLEPEFHRELQRLCEKQGLPLARLIAQIDVTRKSGTNLSSALRLHVLKALKADAENTHV